MDDGAYNPSFLKRHGDQNRRGPRSKILEDDLLDAHGTKLDAENVQMPRNALHAPEDLSGHMMARRPIIDRPGVDQRHGLGPAVGVVNHVLGRDT